MNSLRFYYGKIVGFLMKFFCELEVLNADWLLFCCWFLDMIMAKKSIEFG